MAKTDLVKAKLDHLFRYEYTRWVAILTSRYDIAHIDLIEDSVQEALYKAMRIWPFKAIPDNPSAWIFRTASNKIIDSLRRASKITDATTGDLAAMNIQPEGIIQDEQVKMIFACCNPGLSEFDQIILNLKLNFAFGNAEIGKVLYKSPEAVKKAVTRAKSRFRENVSTLDIPNGQLLNDRLKQVTKVIYLIFTSGYNTFSGDIINKDTCEEALRIASYIDQKDILHHPGLKALIALMCFKISRFPARLDQKGHLVTMENQDRSLWDRELIYAGQRFLMDAAEGAIISQYHLEASIEHEYCKSTSYEDTDWNFILNCYNILLKITPSPSVQLNRVVVMELAINVNSSWKAFCQLKEDDFKSNHLYFAIKGKLEKKLGHYNYSNSIHKAIRLAPSKQEKDYLRSFLDNS